MGFKVLPFLGAAALAAPAFGVTVNMTDFTFGAADEVTAAGTASYSGEAGQFTGTVGGSSFMAYCVEINQSFFFGTDYDYTMTSAASLFTAQKASDLSRLFTAAQGAGFVVNSATSAAMQAAVWEIIYQTGTSYNLSSGDFTVTPESGNAAEAAAFAVANSFLTNLSSYSAAVSVSALANAGAQDFVVVPSIPEPGTWALLAGGLGAIGLMARRRRKA